MTVSAFDVSDARLRTVLTFEEQTLRVWGRNDRSHSVTCSRKVEGACASVVCDNAAYGSTYPETIDAGDVRFSGGVIPSPGLVATRGPREYRADSVVPAPVVREEAEVSVAGSGGVFPRFDLRMNRPTAIEVSSPPRSAAWDGYYALPATTLHGADYAVVWSSRVAPANDAWVLVRVSSPSSPGDLTNEKPYVECAFPATAGSGKVPARLVRDLYPYGRQPTESEKLNLHAVPITIVELSTPGQDQVLSIQIRGEATVR